MKYTVEIRTYTLKPGARDEFMRVFSQDSLPLLERWGVDVVAFGPSLERENGVYLMRAYANLEHRTQSQDAFNTFYGSSEWNEDPRVVTLSALQSTVNLVLELEESTIEALRWKDGQARPGW